MLERILDATAHFVSDNRVFISAASLLIIGLFTSSAFIDFLTKSKDN